jgi:uncharacterized protein with HEPN domain
MRCDPRAFLFDIQEAIEAIHAAVEGVNLAQYQQSRLIRSAVEREFILIGEALVCLSRLDPELFARIEEAPQVIAFRNRLTHEYVAIDNRLVWGVIQSFSGPLLSTCKQLLDELDPSPDRLQDEGSY